MRVAKLSCVGTAQLLRYAPAALQRAAEGDLVRVLEVASHRKPAGEPGHMDPGGSEEAGQVHGGRLALDVGVGGEYDLVHRGAAVLRRLQPLQQLRNSQILRVDPL